MTACGACTSVVDHDRQPAVVLLVALGTWPTAAEDVHAAGPEGRADAPDHARHVAVAEQRDVVGELQVEALAPGLEQVRAFAASDDGADDALALTAGDDGHAHEVGEVAAVLRRVSTSLDPALLGDRRGATGLTSSSVSLQHAEQHFHGQRPGVALADAAEQLDLDAVDRDPSARVMARRPSRARAARRAKHLEVLGRHRRHVDRAGDAAAGERGDLLGGLVAGTVGRLGRQAPRCGVTTTLG